MSMITGFIFSSLSYMKTVDITKSSIAKDVCSSKRNVKLSICKKTQVAIQFISKLLTSIALIYILSAFPQNKLLFLVKTLHRRSSNRSQPYHVVSTQTCFIGRLKQNTPVYRLLCFETVSYSAMRKTSLADGEHLKKHHTHKKTRVRFGEEKYHAIYELEFRQLSKH